MLSEKPRPVRNKIDMADPSQVRIMTRRLGISEPELQRLFETAGDSIAAITKQAELKKQKASKQAELEKQKA